MQKSEPTTWTVVQPTARRREWQLSRGGAMQAVLQIPMLRSGARAGTPDGRLRIERRGRLRSDYAVLDEATGAEIARLRRDGRRRILELDGFTAEWKRLGRKHGFGFVGRDGNPLVSAKVRAGVIRSSGKVEIDPQVGEREATIAALLACYLLIRRNEEAASSAAAATAASS